MSSDELHSLEATTKLSAPPANFPKMWISIPIPDDSSAGRTLFPGGVIAGYNAEYNDYTADTWAAYVMKKSEEYDQATVSYSCSAINSGNTGGRYWFGYTFRSNKPVGPGDFHPGKDVTGARAYTTYIANEE